MQAFLRQAMRDGFFHADMHHATLRRPRRSIVAIDFGIMGGLASGAPLPRGFLYASSAATTLASPRCISPPEVPDTHSVE